MSIFPIQSAAVAELNSRLATGASEYIDASGLTNSQLYNAIMAAEREASRDLRVFLEPTVIVPDDASQTETDALSDSYASFTGYISGRVLTITAISGGLIQVNQSIHEAMPGTIILAQLTGSPAGGIGTYTVSIPQSVGTSGSPVSFTSAMNWYQEAAYDYDPDFFRGEHWGYIVTKEKPIISVTSVNFNYPSPTNNIFSIPHEWIRLDRKYGHIRMVPAAMAFSAPLSAFIMQALGGGRTIPFMIQVRYVAGLSNITKDYPDLIDVIYKMAIFKLLFGSFLPESGSISADGLSQSQNMKFESWRKEIENNLNSMREAIHGIRLMCA